MNLESVKAVFLAAGVGTRFVPFTQDRPKMMVPLLGKPLLQHAVDSLWAAGIRQMEFALSANARAVEEHFRRLALPAATLTFQSSDTLRGTAYCLKASENYPGSVLVYYGDIVLDGDFLWPNFFTAHQRAQADVSIAYKRSADVRSCGVITLAGDRITAVAEKPYLNSPTPVAGALNAAIYLLSSRAVKRVCALLSSDPDPENKINDFMRNIFPRLLTEGYRFAGFDVGDGYWVSVDQPEQYRQLFTDYYAGKLKLNVEPQARQRVADPSWGYQPFLEPIETLF
ncbi:MAG: nucleotidyltransferase family protein [Candidatus Saganbacteria bacterium]|nr:nucleotidyltransferase family protein [Candidatus Saganbacteria bacterium]